MARTLTVNDAYSIMNLLVKEATGQNAEISQVDASNFVSVGETVLASGVENTLNALSLVLGRTFMAVRPYSAKLKIMNVLNSGVYANRLRKISFYSRDAEPTGASNTQLFTNHAPDFDNGSNPDGDGDAQSTASMWKQNPPVPLELNFSGMSEWQDSTTIYRTALQKAFRSPEEFNKFVSGIMTEKGNDIERQKEAFNRMTLLNYIGGVYDLSASNGSVINLTKAYNDYFGTEYTTAQLLSTYLTSFSEFFIAEFKTISDMLEESSTAFHWTPTKTIGDVSYSLLRHTPKAKQKFIAFKPFWNKVESLVKPAIFNTQYLSVDNFEGVNYWQNKLNPSAIDVIPAIPNVLNPASQTSGTEVKLSVVLGMIYDEDGLMIDYQLEDALTTPAEARKHYHNIWWTFRKNAINDFTENAVLFIMEDEEEEEEEVVTG